MAALLVGFVLAVVDPPDEGLPMWAVLLISCGSFLVTLFLGILAYTNTRKSTAGTSTKDIVEAGSLARKDLVEEVTRLAAVIDEQDKQIDTIRRRADADRADCDAQIRTLRIRVDEEQAWSARLARSLREAGLSVPERGTWS